MVAEMFAGMTMDGRGQVEVTVFLRWLFPKDFSGKSVAVSQQPELDIFEATSAPTRGRTLGMTSTALAPPPSAIRMGQAPSEVPARHQLKVSRYETANKSTLRCSR